MLTVKEIQDRVEGIRNLAIRDNEVAHIEEECLYTEVLRSISNGTCEDHKKCAEAALECEKLDYSRWYL